MKKHILFYLGILLVGLSFLGLYLGYKPRAGAIGNGPNDQLIWFTFATQFISGICSILLSVAKKK
ncbi:hypothetical protein LCM10_19710 [Rossellomorea aquimaris]|uniref:hypothetical protein n=1 Tax=Rossellomorea aquimaris TaxID=189382 RepID=UPI001CD4264A|nr:hypothetical protein [Rossellomorea aquimaris]MCA1057176.1 hypothetical protein [Rossellomorea aquimaris]